MSAPLPLRSPFARALGEAFEALPGPVRRLHGATQVQEWRGLAEVIRGRGLWARLIAWAARLPAAGPQQTLRFRIQTDPQGRQHWRRQFDHTTMPSTLWTGADGLLHERLGLTVLRYTLHPQAAGLRWIIVGVRVAGVVPLPRRWFRQVGAFSGVDAAGQYVFDVHATLPWVGLLVRYRGTLQPVTQADSRPAALPADPG